MLVPPPPAKLPSFERINIYQPLYQRSTVNTDSWKLFLPAFLIPPGALLDNSQMTVFTDKLRNAQVSVWRKLRMF